MRTLTNILHKFNLKGLYAGDTFLGCKNCWWWIGEIFDEWCYTMTHDDGEFFIYLQSDYVRYEEDFYYTKVK